MSPRLPLGLIGLAILTGLAAAGQEVTTAPSPEWVEVLPLEEPAGGAPEGTIDLWLYDFQENVTTSPLESYTRVVKQVLNEQGVQYESQIELDFDPSYQELVLHAVAIHRDGQRLDRLDPERIQVIQREEQLEAQILDGEQTALLLLEDVRVGDVIDYSYTRRGRSPVFGERYFSSLLMGFQVPVRRIRQRILWPAGRELGIRNLGTEVEPETCEVEGGRELLWDLRDVPASLVDDGLPPWFIALPWVQLSEYADWAEVARWGEQLFRVSGGPGDEVRALAQSVRESADEPREQVRLALRSVQSQVRYLGIMLGEGAHRPSSPDEVLARRFGDCKDKALLLTTVLAELDIPARPALVSTTALGRVVDDLPNPGSFDHVIVQVWVGDEELWVDPTLGHERGPLDEHALLDYGLALVLAPDSAGLVLVNRDLGTPAHTLIEKSFDVQLDTPTRLSIVTTYEGAEANQMRLALDSLSTEELSSVCVNYLAQEYPSANELRPPEVEDDQDRNRVVLREEYEVPGIWTHDHAGEAHNWARFYASEVSGELMRPASSRRSAPFSIPHPRHVTCRIVANLPDDWDIAPERSRIENAAFHFDRKLDYGARRLDIRMTYHTLADHVLAGQVAGYLADLDRVEGELGWEVSDPRVSPEGFELSDEVVAMGVLVGAVLGGFALALAIGLFLILRSRAKRVERVSRTPAASLPSSRPTGITAPPAPLPAEPSPFADPLSLSVGGGAGYASARVADAPALRTVPDVAAAPVRAPDPVRREGRAVVLELDAELPPRCVRCNEPATVHRKRKLRWHTPWLYLLILAGILIYAVVALIVMKRTEVAVGYCTRHHRGRILALFGNTAAFLGGVALWVYAPESGWVFLLGAVGVLFGIVNGIRLSNGVRASFMDDRVVKLVGLGRPFRESV